MSEVLGLEHLGLLATGPTLTLSVGQAQALTVCGPAGSGKSRLLRVLTNSERPAQGSVRISGSVSVSETNGLPRRMRVQNLARKGGALLNSAAKATDILLATRLWDVRHSTIGDLTPSQVAACELIEPLSSDADLIVIDGQLDRLDPWALKVVMDHITALRSRSTSFVIATNRPDIVGAFDAVVVLKELHVRFAGTVDDLIRLGPPHTLHVATDNRPGVQALVSPFEVTVRETPDGVRLEATEGQSLAARLLLEGYGDIKFVVIRPPSVEEALLSLM
jgi:ABC-type multidrug transport system ATPase subunit